MVGTAHAATKLNQNRASSIEHSDRAFSHPIKFADTFPYSLIRVFDRIKNISHLLVKAFVIQRLTSCRYTCGFAALTRNTDATLGFVQPVYRTHALNLVGESVNGEVAHLNARVLPPGRSSEELVVGLKCADLPRIARR